MIVPMKKVFLLAQKKDLAAALQSLAELGTVHVEHLKTPSSASIAKVKEDMAALTRACNILGALPQDANPAEAGRETDGQKVCREVLETASTAEALRQEIHKVGLLVSVWEQWGNFNPQDIRALPKQGFFVELAEIPKNVFSSVPGHVACRVIKETKGMLLVVLVSREAIKVPFHTLTLPEMSLEELKRSQERDKAKLEKAQEKLLGLKPYQRLLEKRILALQQELKFEEALAGAGESEEWMYLKGFVPAERGSQLLATAKKNKWAVTVENLSDEDRPPTLLRNPRWISIIEPVFKVMNVLPGYRELDISLFFLLFFSVFFGILVGDAGYGLVFLLMTFYAHRKLGRRMPKKAVFFLMYVLSFSTVIWGVLTGVFFGQGFLGLNLKPALPWLADNKNVQMLCFLIGASHLTVAHLWRGIIKMPGIIALSEIGWISLLWGSFFLARLLILGDPLPQAAKWLFITGPVFVILFSQPDKNILKAIGGGLGNLLLSAVNMFTDVVSYIRLFAVGLASVAVANAFNQMAAGVGFSNVFVGLGTAFILVFGHLLNIALCVLAVLVHGVRLNVLEFSSHLNMEWTGTSYDPFRKINEIKV